MVKASAPLKPAFHSMKRRKGLLHYALAALLVSLCIPIAAYVSGLLFFRYSIPTPGIYAATLLIPPNPAGKVLEGLIPELLVAGIVNLLCCYAVIRVLVAGVRRYIEGNGPPGPSGRT